MGFLQVVDTEMGVDLGRFQRLMTKKFLHGPDIGLISEHSGGAGMAEGVRRDILFDPGLFRVLFDQFPDHILRQPVAPGR